MQLECHHGLLTCPSNMSPIIILLIYSLTKESDRENAFIIEMHMEMDIFPWIQQEFQLLCIL